MLVIVQPAADPRGPVTLRLADDDGALLEERTAASLSAAVGELEPSRPRWVWDDARVRYPPVLAAGLRVQRCLDLRLTRGILRGARATAGTPYAAAATSAWDALPEPVRQGETEPVADALFDLEPRAALPPLDAWAEWQAQRAAVAAAGPAASALSLLLAAESVGALIACELEHTGLPFDRAALDEILERELGPRPVGTERPARLEELLTVMRGILDDPGFTPDSPVELLKSLHRAGLRVESTRSWELKHLEHPVIAPLLEYKKLARLWTANGWTWADTWIADGRFRPGYVPGGVVTGRWAASGGGALQLPKQVRGAVLADPGWRLVVADAAQLEPRVLAAMSHDDGMARAGRGDLYQGIVDSGAVQTRAQAKVAMLGAMYGATTGESARLLPSLGRTFPRAMRLVDEAAKAGESGGVVTTLLGRTSPRPTGEWARTASGEAVGDATQQRRDRTQGRSWGRFTRNFVVQGTAAEWALSWMGLLRERLWELGGVAGGADAAASARPHLVFFLHDEVVVHTPAELEAEVVEAVHATAAAAARLLFGGAPVPFPVTAVAVDRYADAK